MLRAPLLVLLSVLAIGCGGTPEIPTIAAAASLREVVPDLIAAWGGDLRVTYGASGTLRRQVEAGAPIDAVLFASPAPVDALIGAGLADPASRGVAATNGLVLIGPPGSPLRLATLDKLPTDARIAIGDPRVVPAGTYARTALTDLGQWDALTERLVYGGDVSMVLAYARRGEVAAAIVYATEADGIPDIDVLDRADRPVAEVVVAAAVEASPSARDFLAFVLSPAGAAVFADHGFGPPHP